MKEAWEAIKRLAKMSKVQCSSFPALEEIAEPMDVVASWVAEAAKLPMAMPTGAALSTVDRKGLPQVRFVLPKKFDQQGVVFYTHADSAKGQAISDNPYCEICWYFDAFARQIRVAGKVEIEDAEASDAYFASRPRQSQLGAWASLQSQPLENPDDFQVRLDEVTKKFEGQDVPRPEGWCGYRIVPERVELWQGRAGRLHERYGFEKSADGWTAKRLYP